ncbi:hypothetical protein SAMN05444161_0024 [Rhizobiales bacterium GAS191]|nr:hypothetical protein SAMN05444161_0024 [Rhizobiales bacterium GAS191]
MSRKPTGPELGMLCGARALAGYIFGDEEEHRRVYGLQKELGLFKLRGMLCGRRATIDARIREHEKTAVAA